MIEPEQSLDVVPKGLGRRGPDRKETRLLELRLVTILAYEKSDTRTGELIVHHRVPHVSLKPALGVAPDLADNVRLGVDRTYARPEFTPESVVVDLVGDIEPPAVDAKLDPHPGDSPEKLAHLGARHVEFGQGRQSPPRLIVGRLLTVVGIERKSLDGEPVEVRGVRPVFHDVV